MKALRNHIHREVENTQQTHVRDIVGRLTRQRVPCAQVSRRYYNSHALVDVTLSAVFDPPLKDGKLAENAKVRSPRIVVSSPVTISKGAPCVDVRQAVCDMVAHFSTAALTLKSESTAAGMLDNDDG